MINWKIRFKNKVFLLTFITTIITFIYQMLGIFSIVPKISENDLINVFSILINLCATLGIIVDPTTSGVTDSARAMTYIVPNSEK